MQAPSQASLDEVRKGWETHSKKLFARDGSNEGFEFGGHDIAHNQRLQATLREIAEGYIPFCARKCELHDQLGQAADGKLEDELRNIDILVNQHTVAMWQKLLGEESGLQEEAQRQASKYEPAMQVRKRIAKELIGAIAVTLAGACSRHRHPQSGLLGLIPKVLDEGLG